jgi:hypothetical protein
VFLSVQLHGVDNLGSICETVSPKICGYVIPNLVKFKYVNMTLNGCRNTLKSDIPSCPQNVWVEMCPKFEDDNLYVNFLAEIEF